MTSKGHIWLYFGIALLLFQSCKITRHVKEGQHLVVRSEIHLNENKKFEFEADEDDLQAVLKQKPNRRILSIVPFHLSVWNWATTRKKDKKLNEYLRTTIGEEPVIYEPILLIKSREQLEQTLFNNGYFDAHVEAYASLDHNTAELHYYINSGPAYRIKSVSYSFEDTAMIKEFASGVKMRFKAGDRFDSELFNAERNRVTRLMKNRGYYTFEKIHILFDVDTNMAGEKFTVAVKLRNLRISETIDGQDTITQKPHQVYYINEVLINEDYNQKSFNRLQYDTLNRSGLTFVFVGRHYIRPQRISRNIFVRQGDKYSLERSDYTYERLNALNNYRFIDLKYVASETDSSKALLDVRINLTKNARQAMSLETTGTNRSGILGANAAINYENRNLFHGAEQFDWRVYGGLEVQRTLSTEATDEEGEGVRSWAPNTYQVGTQMTFTIPDFIFSRSSKRTGFLREPKSSFSITGDYQERPEYTRTLFNLAFQYSFRIRDRDHIIFAPVDISYIQLDKDPDFQTQLDLTNNSLLINSYNDHVVAAGRLSYSYTTQDVGNPRRNFYYYRANLEVAGNLLRASSGLLGLPQDSTGTSYLINNIAFAQYVKVDFNYVKYINIKQGQRAVYRGYGGIGIPLANLNVLPFERSFYAGGSNGVRAWRIRGLGPGGVSETETYGVDQVGQMQLEFNAEYRFRLIKQVEGAAFLDAGNIWFLEDNDRPEAEFKIDRFYREIALSPGIGLRLNFNFFVFRFDTGLQLKDPALPVGERWLFQPKAETFALRQAANAERVANDLDRVTDWDKPYRPEFTLNLAIAYPF